MYTHTSVNSWPSLSGLQYFTTFINDKTRYTEVAILKQKSEILVAWKEYKNQAEKQTAYLIKKVRSHNAKEYTSNEFTEYHLREEIVQHL